MAPCPWPFPWSSSASSFLQSLLGASQPALVLLIGSVYCLRFELFSSFLSLISGACFAYDLVPVCVPEEYGISVSMMRLTLGMLSIIQFL